MGQFSIYNLNPLAVISIIDKRIGRHVRRQNIKKTARTFGLLFCSVVNPDSVGFENSALADPELVHDQDTK